MREIKFRFGWYVTKDDEDRGEQRMWAFEIYDLDELLAGRAVPLGEAFASYQTRDEWSGFRDKNGREVYEGDILGSEHITNCDVHLTNGTFFAGDCDLFDIAAGYHGDCIIIGNIYENPELLETT